ncbi:hypothetical protein ACU4HD_40795 [Cupriavidus basilensis]
MQIDIASQSYVAYHEIEVWTGGVKRRQFQLNGNNFDWTYEDSANANAVSPSITFIARAVNSDNQAGLDTSFTVSNPAPAGVGYVYSEVGDFPGPYTPQLSIAPSTDTDMYRAELRVGSTSGALVWSGTSPAVVMLDWATTYKLFQSDVWGNQSAVSTITTPPPDSGGGGG